MECSGGIGRFGFAKKRVGVEESQARAFQDEGLILHDWGKKRENRWVVGGDERFQFGGGKTPMRKEGCGNRGD